MLFDVSLPFNWNFCKRWSWSCRPTLHYDARTTDQSKMDHHFEGEDLKIEGNGGGRFVARFWRLEQKVDHLLESTHRAEARRRGACSHVSRRARFAVRWYLEDYIFLMLPSNTSPDPQPSSFKLLMASFTVEFFEETPTSASAAAPQPMTPCMAHMSVVKKV